MVWGAGDVGGGRVLLWVWFGVGRGDWRRDLDGPPQLSAHMMQEQCSGHSAGVRDAGGKLLVSLRGEGCRGSSSGLSARVRGCG